MNKGNKAAHPGVSDRLISKKRELLKGIREQVQLDETNGKRSQHDWMYMAMMEDSLWLDSYQDQVLDKIKSDTVADKFELLDETASSCNVEYNSSAACKPCESQKCDFPASEFVNFKSERSCATTSTLRLLAKAGVYKPVMKKDKLLS
ncbi:hypothetical protein GUITHDRAFT_150045 [Guillardia theta CCMP2712]|uniref:Uncharacterized protein n=1 Tax=Guillardia theta (strain CCMP2712) TaxID=905079 RepID=L1K276_GUITC|nr:hypothetical protein GUITHDRAFT_150045 [Guillardia theta CCMP2712]EKX54555.1 hypothetical protein GUITHDRAFT_150045 [Guillardia theta CCMP2712]|mmetsp:Transcript_25494/g.84300  ORF Transcript_25494/g.84300 Transcript_25494/m.84300 type:complete len:148 (-) Transcript_25494:58-501(-)|eukprot:XP_005841535.1 hypothetical protein GUITHDRAFT_150045 [Guillardia theta CCMP2712]